MTPLFSRGGPQAARRRRRHPTRATIAPPRSHDALSSLPLPGVAEQIRPLPLATTRSGGAPPAPSVHVPIASDVEEHTLPSGQVLPPMPRQPSVHVLVASSQ